ncbi:hypothetical protein AM593_10206, partial [Mytilus galloprovincialis]
LDEIGATLGKTIRQVKELQWLPFPFPPQCKIICTMKLEGWIPDTLRLFAVCRGGLTVEEVLTILQTLGYCNTREVKSYDWLQFRNCIGNFLLEKANGLLDFSHQHLKEIVEYVLLRGAKKKDSRKNQMKQFSLRRFEKSLPYIITVLLDLD